MAPKKEADLFNKIIADGRERQKNEAIANAMLGGGSRRASAPGPGTNRRAGGSLASRVGISKATRVGSPLSRPSSASPATSFRNGNSLHSRPLNRTTSDSRLDRRARAVESLANTDIQSSHLRNQVNFRDSTNGAGFSIRGQASAEWVTVVAQNFADGTTAEDIELALQSLVVDEEVKCRITSSKPTVIAEMQFMDRNNADKVVSTFNNQKADGRQLYVYIKDKTNAPARSSKTQAGSQDNRGNRVERDNRNRVEQDDEMQDVDEDRRRYDEQRRHDEERRNRRAEPEYQDGRYGFNDGRAQDSRPPRDSQGRGDRGLYSDNMPRAPRGGSSYRGGGYRGR